MLNLVLALAVLDLEFDHFPTKIVLAIGFLKKLLIRLCLINSSALITRVHTTLQFSLVELRHLSAFGVVRRLILQLAIVDGYLSDDYHY